MTREEWLLAMTDELRPLFAAAGAPLPPKLRVSCGWPSRRALASPTSNSRTIGQCWPTGFSADATPEVFVSPYLADAVEVAAVLVHELIHVFDNCQNGHKGPFRRIALALGLAGKMTATHAGPELVARLNALCAKVGPYPHASLDASQLKKQSTRMLKVECPDCGYTVRTSALWIEVGLPTCPCGSEMECAQ
jgi:hypothetical protein